ncbi:MAG: ATPase, T2SS/T4P/T4SS family [Candidatus Magasanikbacteria bacterium]
MNIDDKKIKQILLDGNYVTAEDISKAETAIKTTQGTVVEWLLSSEIINKDLLGQAIAESYKVSYSDLNTYKPSQEQVRLLPEEVAKQFHAVIFRQTDKELTIATDDPTQAELTKKLKTIFKGKKIVVTFSFTEDVEESFIHYLKTLETRFNEIIKQQKRIAPEIIDEIVDDAVAYRASDIHLEPQEKEVIVRFRIDGVMQEAGRIPKDYYGNILNRIKVQAQLPIDEHFSAQDGAARQVREKYTVDMRISILPTLNGEKVVIRLLSQYVRSFSFSDLGLSKHDQELLLKAINKPFGMILVTGPTGSGKTTSLYALLKLLNNPTVNITTIEDPVEYKMPGVNQIQVNSQTNLTFAKGLRSIVRQDPDIILVGEIRDQETAETAVNAALTGHLLLSTFHANDAATAVPRLLDMDIEPFLLSSTLVVLIAQRLVRKICDQCRFSTTLSKEDVKKTIPQDAQKYFSGKHIVLYKGKGCASCGNTGFRGRTAIYEFIEVTPELQELILQHPSTAQIWKIARKQGSVTLFEDGIEKVKNGITTLEELLRMAEPPKF